ncbi:MAG: hypothetical protein MUF23_17360, partial [Pirellula sp.]|nr:hypothetical protein [Pirellula sp.]
PVGSTNRRLHVVSSGWLLHRPHEAARCVREEWEVAQGHRRHRASDAGSEFREWESIAIAKLQPPKTMTALRDSN